MINGHIMAESRGERGGKGGLIFIKMDSMSACLISGSLGSLWPTDWLNRKQGSRQKVIALGVTTQVPARPVLLDWLISVLSISPLQQFALTVVKR